MALVEYIGGSVRTYEDGSIQLSGGTIRVLTDDGYKNLHFDIDINAEGKIVITGPNGVTIVDTDGTLIVPEAKEAGEMK